MSFSELFEAPKERLPLLSRQPVGIEDSQELRTRFRVASNGPDEAGKGRVLAVYRPAFSR